ncbi:MAG TPA: hypothetical protein VK891_11745, partial [Euzebyales bacterium]|nr:hypothetical protein [Euzebyales bacterium]
MRPTLIALFAILAMLAAACGGDQLEGGDEGGDERADGGGSEATAAGSEAAGDGDGDGAAAGSEPLDGATIIVGSKDFD